MDYYLGIDLGGTSVKAGVVDSRGRILGKASEALKVVPTPSSAVRRAKKVDALSADAVIQKMVLAANEAVVKAKVERKRIVAVGIDSPGEVSIEKGTVVRSANFPAWKNVSLRAKLSQALKLPAILENDAKAAAYGEWWAGAGHKTQSMFIITLGTGVGGGIVRHGQIDRGTAGQAGEIGHMIVVPGGEKCGCGQHGCLERYCSARFMAERAARALEASPSLRKQSSLAATLKAGLTAADVEHHARAGDPFACNTWDEMCRHLALTCITICRLVDPEMIAFGGGMAGAGSFLLNPIRRHFKAESWTISKLHVKLALAGLGNDAGLIGAAGLAKQAREHHVLAGVGK